MITNKEDWLKTVKSYYYEITGYELLDSDDELLDLHEFNQDPYIFVSDLIEDI